MEATVTEPLANRSVQQDHSLPCLVIQIGLKQGRSAEIHKLEDRELYVGRAYSNDIVLTDPYVAPQQLRIYRLGVDANEVGWYINVLDVTNPVLVNGEPLEAPTATVQPGDTITVGRTQMRLYSDEHPVEPTRKLLVSSWLHKAARSPTIPLVLFGFVCLLDSLCSYWLTNIDGDWQGHALNTVTGITLLLGWACGWAIVGRVLRHQPHFSHQLLVTTMVAAAGLLQAPLEVLIEFLTDNIELRTWVAYAFATVLFAYLLHYNLFFATNIKHTALIACGFSLSVSLLIFLYSVSDEDDFEFKPEFSSTLLPPVVNSRSAIELDDYWNDIDKMLSQ